MSEMEKHITGPLSRGKKGDEFPGRSHYYCCVPMCNSDGRFDPQLSFHRIPTDPIRRRKWIKNIRREPGINFRITNCTRVCCIHFEREEIRLSANGKRLLCSAAVPTLFKWNKADIDEDRRAYEAMTPSVNPPEVVQLPDVKNQRNIFKEQVRSRRVTTCKPHSTEQHRKEEIRSVYLDHRYADTIDNRSGGIVKYFIPESSVKCPWIGHQYKQKFHPEGRHSLMTSQWKFLN